MHRPKVRNTSAFHKKPGGLSSEWQPGSLFQEVCWRLCFETGSVPRSHVLWPCLLAIMYPDPCHHHLSLKPRCVVKHSAPLNMVTNLHVLQKPEVLLRQYREAKSQSWRVAFSPEVG